jgi:NAD+ synthase (glutamine-hydrolysing)
MIIVNGEIVAQASQFGLEEVEVVTAVCDLEAVRSFRCIPSRGLQAQRSPVFQRIETDFRLSPRQLIIDSKHKPTPSIEPKIHPPEEEIALGPACWMFDYLRRSRQAGFALALSGGIDSCSTAVITYSMCRLVFRAIQNGSEQVLKDCRRICVGDEKSDWLPKSPEEICSKVLHTVYMGTKAASSPETRRRAKELSQRTQAYHIDLNMDTVVSALTTLFTSVTSFSPRFKTDGGAPAESLALQNIQGPLLPSQTLYISIGRLLME